MSIIPILFFIFFIFSIKSNNSQKEITTSDKLVLAYILLVISIFSTFVSIVHLSLFNILVCIILDMFFGIYITNIKKSSTNISYANTISIGEKKCNTCNSLNHLSREYCYACGEKLTTNTTNEEYSPFVVDSKEKLLNVRRLTPEDLVMPINDKFMLGLQDKAKEKEISNNFTDENHNHKESFDDLKNKILSEIYSKKYGTYIGYVVETSKKFIIIALCNDCISTEKWNITTFTKKHDYRPELDGTCYVEVESDKDMHDTFYIEVKIIQENKDTIIKMTNKHSGQHPHEYMIFDSTGEHTNYGLL